MKTQPDANDFRTPRRPGNISPWLALSLLLISLLACDRTFLSLPGGADVNSTALPSGSSTASASLSKPATGPTTTPRPETETSVIITDIQGGVQVRTSPAAALKPAVLGQTLPLEASVQTDANGLATLQFPDGSIVRIASGTTFQLVEVGNTISNPNTAVKLNLGTLFIFVSPALGQRVFDVQTPAGVASVHGSYIRVDYYPESDTVILTCLETQATCTLIDATDGITLIMTNGKRGFIIFGQPYGQVEAMTAEDVEEFLAAMPDVIQVLPTVFPNGTPTPALFRRTPIPSATPTTACVPTTLPCPTTVP